MKRDKCMKCHSRVVIGWFQTKGVCTRCYTMLKAKTNLSETTKRRMNQRI